MLEFSEMLAKIDGEIVTTSKKAAGLLSEALTAIDDELKVAAQAVGTEIKTDLQAAAPEIKKDITDIVKNGIPVVWPLVTAGSAPLAIINAGYAYFQNALPHLFEEIWMTLASELSMKVKSIQTVSIQAPTVRAAAPAADAGTAS